MDHHHLILDLMLTNLTVVGVAMVGVVVVVGGVGTGASTTQNLKKPMQVCIT